MTQTKRHKNSEQDAVKDMKLSPENGEALSPDRTIGAFLRDEREKKGLSYDQIFEVTKIRPPFLEALENESWDSLPSPVFAGGFVRSYGRALGVEEEKVMALFEKTRPKTVSAPEPLVAPARSRKAFAFILIFLLLALVAAYFFWKGYAGHDNMFTNRTAIRPAETKPEKSEKIRGAHKEVEPMISMEQPQSDSALETDPESEDIGQANEFSEKVEESTDESASVATIDASTAPELTLKANVREMTWLRIFIDDQDPKEYTFRPEQHYQWKAKKGFELLIGNAGGIDFELNGEAVEYAGTPGKVVRLRVPKDYKRRRLQD